MNKVGWPYGVAGRQQRGRRGKGETFKINRRRVAAPASCRLSLLLQFKLNVSPLWSPPFGLYDPLRPPQALHRTPDAGQNTELFHTLVETCKRYGIDPYAWFRDVLPCINDYPVNNIADLFPGNHHLSKNGRHNTRS